MSSRTRLNPARRNDPGSGLSEWLPLIMVGAVGVLVLAVWLPPFLLGQASANPVLFFLELVQGRANYPVAAVGILAGVVVAAAAMGAGLVMLVRRSRRGRTRIDDRARSMAQPRDLEVMHSAGAVHDAARLGMPDALGGPPVGRLLPSRLSLRVSMEWVQIWIMGPRAGKTTCVCIPQIVDAPGCAVVTSNKRDLVDMTRGPRSMQGTVWVFDPQQVIGERPTWWWNPLTFVESFERAEQLASLFMASGRDEGARTDAYFDGEAQNYLATLLLAAAASEQPITKIHAWMSDPVENEPAILLELEGWATASATLEAIISLPDKQRDGVVGTARKAMNWLANPEIVKWVALAGPDDSRPQFDPAAFVESRQTLYSVSKEGAGSARAVTAALTVATITAAERIASRSRGGRLATPMLVMLDEAANVVRWPDLPDLYSHFGSRGILVCTILQSWNQGVAVWGKDGMEKLWSAANVRVVGAGLAQSDFLQSVSTLIGDHDVVRRDISQSPKSGGMFESSRSTSTRLQRERIFDASDLASLPRARAVMLSSGAPSALLELVHWTQTDCADLIRESEAFYGTQLQEPAPAAVVTAGEGR